MDQKRLHLVFVRTLRRQCPNHEEQKRRLCPLEQVNRYSSVYHSSSNKGSEEQEYVVHSTTATTPHHPAAFNKGISESSGAAMLKDSALTLRSFGSCVRCTGNTRHPCGKLKKSTSRKTAKAGTVWQVLSDEHVKHIMALFAASEGRMNEDLAVQFASEVQSSVLRFFSDGHARIS